MKDYEVDSVFEVINSMFKIPGTHAIALKRKLKALNINPPSKNRWIDKAREVAVDLIQNRGEATINDVLDEIPLPDDLSGRTIGGVFTHPMFQRIGNRTVKDGKRWKTIGVFVMSD